jgi:hypothetical protein
MAHRYGCVCPLWGPIRPQWLLSRLDHVCGRCIEARTDDGFGRAAAEIPASSAEAIDRRKYIARPQSDLDRLFQLPPGSTEIGFAECADGLEQPVDVCAAVQIAGELRAFLQGARTFSVSNARDSGARSGSRSPEITGISRKVVGCRADLTPPLAARCAKVELTAHRCAMTIFV